LLVLGIVAAAGIMAWVLWSRTTVPEAPETSVPRRRRGRPRSLPQRAGDAAPRGSTAASQTGAEPAEVTIAFKEVRLDAAVPVVHKHGVGSCQGRLIASLEGLRYEAISDDAFSRPFAEIEAFDVDYLKRNLRVKRRGGKTWNFTDPGNADPLFGFHRDVEKARVKSSR
jgi:hypothetical protein